MCFAECMARTGTPVAPTIGPPTPRRRGWVIGGAIVVVVLIGALVLVATSIDDSSRDVGVDEALDRFRNETIAPSETDDIVDIGDVDDTGVSGGPTPESVVLPSIGVYTYGTVGAEGVDALGGTQHDCPAESTITVTTSDCGVHLRWEPLVERRDEWELCSTTDGVELGTSGVAYHQFYGQDETETLTCDEPIPVTDATARIERSCMLADEPWPSVWEFVGTDVRTIGSETVEVTLLRMTIDDNDDYWEHTVIDWMLAPNGLPIEVHARASSRSPSIAGPVVYDETYDLELVSLTPQS